MSPPAGPKRPGNLQSAGRVVPAAVRRLWNRLCVRDWIVVMIGVRPAVIFEVRTLGREFLGGCEHEIHGGEAWEFCVEDNEGGCSVMKRMREDDVDLGFNGMSLCI